MYSQNASFQSWPSHTTEMPLDTTGLGKFPRKENPFKNDVILRHLFHFCDFKQLNKCRMVCWQWYDISLLECLKIEVALCGYDPKFIVNTNPVPYKPTLEKFLDTFETSVDHTTKNIYDCDALRLYKRFKLHYSFFGSDSSLLTRFWKFYGNQITHLHLHYITYTDLQLFYNVMLSRFTPNLEKLVVSHSRLKFHHQDINNDTLAENLPVHSKLKWIRLHVSEVLAYRSNEPNRRFPLNWTELLSRYPDLVRLQIVFTTAQWKQELEMMLKAIAAIRSEDSSKLCLTSLNILSFERLHILLVPETFPNFPEMDSLSDLNIKVYSQRDLTFLRTCRNLKSLDLRRCNRVGGSVRLGPEWNIFQQTRFARKMDGVVMGRLNKLRIIEKDIWTEADIKSMSDWMPNLMHLEMELRNETFRRVCQYWPNMKELHVMSHTVNDYGITGIQDEKNLVPTKNNISNLQELQVFTIGRRFLLTDSHPPRLELITEKSITHGFLKLPCLKEISIHMAKIDDEIATIMKKKIPNVCIRKRINGRIKRYSWAYEDVHEREIGIDAMYDVW